MTLKVRVTRTGAISNRADISAELPDSVAANDQARTTTTAQGTLTGPGGGTPGTGPSAGQAGALKFKVKLVKRVRRNASRWRRRVPSRSSIPSAEQMR